MGAAIFGEVAGEGSLAFASCCTGFAACKNSIAEKLHARFIISIIKCRSENGETLLSDNNFTVISEHENDIPE